MKTNQEMVRYIDSFSVVQRTSDGYFDGTELLRQWNNVEGNPRRQMSKFLESDNTSEFLKALAEDESHRAKMLIGENQLLIKVKGRNTKEGKTPDKVWMNPLLFIKFAMWINPAFEVKVLRFVYDEMIRYRNDAGDAYKELGSAVQKIVPKEFMPKAMQKVVLVYIDPPFASGADYAKKVYIRRNPKVAEAIAQAEQELDIDELKAFEEKMYGD